MGCLRTPCFRVTVKKQDTESQKTLRISELEPRKDQPRRNFDEAALEQLAASIKSNGVLQPILVTRQPNGFYSIIAGERRFRASKIAGLTEVPVIIIEADDKKIAEITEKPIKIHTQTLRPLHP